MCMLNFARLTWSQKRQFIWLNPRFLCPFKVELKVWRDRVLGSLGRRLLMTSTQKPNTVAPQSALCICSRKWKTRLIVPIYFGTKNVQVLFQNHFSFVTGIRVKFRLGRLRNKLRSSTFDNCELRLELWQQFAIFQAMKGKTSWRTSCLYIRNGKLDMKWRSRQTKSR